MLTYHAIVLLSGALEGGGGAGGGGGAIFRGRDISCTQLYLFLA